MPYVASVVVVVVVIVGGRWRRTSSLSLPLLHDFSFACFLGSCLPIFSVRPLC